MEVWYYWIDIDNDRVAGRSNSKAFALDSALRFATTGPATMAPRKMRVLCRHEDTQGESEHEEIIAEFAVGGHQIAGEKISQEDLSVFDK